MKRVLDGLKDASVEQRSRVKEAVQTALQDGSLQVEYVVKEKNARIVQLEQERHLLKGKLAQMERLAGPLGGDAASLMQQKDGEMLALQTGAKKESALTLPACSTPPAGCWQRASREL